MDDNSRTTVGRLVGWIALFTLLGTPLVAYLWETLNQVLAGHFDLTRIGLSLPLLAALWILLIVLARLIQRWDDPGGPPHAPGGVHE
jgi:hypothetical protein